jgi:hypothetical protein
MQMKDIISTLMLSDFYFSLPLWERKQVVSRLWALYGPKLPPDSSRPCSFKNAPNEIAPWTGTYAAHQTYCPSFSPLPSKGKGQGDE